MKSSYGSNLQTKKSSLYVSDPYLRGRVCVSSKAAIMVLFWTFAMNFANIMLHEKRWFVGKIFRSIIENDVYIVTIVLGYSAILQCIFPIAGYLADTRFGRYKTILVSLWVLLLVNIAIATLVLFLLYEKKSTTTNVITALVYFLFLVGMPGFRANIIQFGLDQVFYAAAEEQRIFVHWYVWCYNLSGLLINLIFNIEIFNKHDRKISHALLSLLFGLVTIAVLASFYFFFCRRKRWFLTESRFYNPYTMVYNVTKYLLRLKFPTRNHSAPPPSDSSTGLDLSNNQYKETFSVSQVEDVKAFYRVMKVLLSLGLVFFIHTAERHTSSLFTDQSKFEYDNDSNHSSFTEEFLPHSTLYYAAMMVILSTHIFLIRPYIKPLLRHRYLKLLTRIGIGILCSILALLTLFIFDITFHNRNQDCIFKIYSNSTSNVTHHHESHTLLQHSEYLLLLKHFLTALSHAILYVALYEFICTQSPQSMKGFLIGVSYAIRGLSEILASLLMILFAIKYNLITPSCSMIYYIVNIAVGAIALMIFIGAARGHKYRVRRFQAPMMRDYGQNYYSKLQNEDSCESNIRNYGT